MLSASYYRLAAASARQVRGTAHAPGATPMPQPALHLLIAEDTLRHWRERPHIAPFPMADDAALNAFRHGCLAPDYGLFPGGDRHLGAISHRGGTGVLLRAVLDGASSPAQQAFAWGWLTHILADVAIHPLINRAAAAHAGGSPTLADHVRVEVGVDVQFVWQHATLRALRLRPAFDRDTFTFVADAVRGTHGYPLTTSHLVSMQRGMIHFTHAALHFTTSLARNVCWDGEAAASGHRSSVLLWRTVTALTSRSSKVHAWLNPVEPPPWLIAETMAALDALPHGIDQHVATRLAHLPDYNLETGTTGGDADLRVA